MNLNDLRTILGLPYVEDVRIFSSSGDVVSENDIQVDVSNGQRPARMRRLSMENMQLMRITPDKQQVSTCSTALDTGLCYFFVFCFCRTNPPRPTCARKTEFTSLRQPMNACWESSLHKL